MDINQLKNVWKEQKTTSFSREQILAMLKRKSSSVAKWIFYISLGEFIFWILFSLLLPESSLKLNNSSEFFVTAISVVNYIVIIGFIILFFINFKKIKVEQNVSELLANIFRLRKTVRYYIIYNLAMFVLSVILSTWWILIYDSEAINIPSNVKNNTAFWLGLVFAVFTVTLIIVISLYFFYRLLYGFLLRRLKKNYEELKQLQ
ncbi:hypothetical protein C7377_1287 [Balneicella halophila]|uniref:Beta-carotene 15,15'-monooxygenase n=1 Tax=Balneicella halophila TaxID=1537566 RepID=A0A7L4UPY9_BALHA|nr:hypothetical protein [Balneicella halophila]PVX50957.1 hypothetical protein C7377_1287 [Balneicella halophila]